MTQLNDALSGFSEPVILSRACPPNCCENKIKEALSARDKEWEEKIEKFFITPEWDYSEREIRINIDDWNKLLSQMKEGK